jgi:hypothetical protein
MRMCVHDPVGVSEDEILETGLRVDDHEGWSVRIPQARVIWVRTGESRSRAGQIAWTIYRAVSKLLLTVGQWLGLSFIRELTNRTQYMELEFSQCSQ